MDRHQIKIVRTARRMSQWALANATGIDRSRLSLIENGHVTPTAEQLVLIREALNWTEEIEPHLEALK